MKSLVPLGDKVVVKPLEAEERTSGGIVLPDAAREKPRQGRVLSVGDGHLLPDGRRVKHEVSEGDRVIYSKYSGSEVRLGDEEFLILSEDDILAVMG
jgi:chaperonin GroES